MYSKKELLDEGDVASWIYTFSDLMTLLLVFFVLLFSLSNMEETRFKDAMNSLNQAFDGSSNSNSIIDLPHEAPVKPEVPDEIQEILPATKKADTEGKKPEESEVSRQDISVQLEWQHLSDDLKQQLQSSSDNSKVEVGDFKNGKIVIVVKGDLLFPSGSAQFRRDMMPVLDDILLMLKKNPQFKLGIHGHTDNIPIATSRFPSNWDLSAIRATNVLRYMVRGGIEIDRVSASGYGESMPIAPNNSKENRAKNRRLEFVLERRIE